MAFRYTVTHYSFREPKAISEYEYLNLKQKLQNDPNFSLIDPNDTITNNYGRLFKFLTGALISFPICLVLMLNEELTKDNGFLVLIMAVTTLWSIGGLFAFLMSATDLRTYAGYLKKKRAYFGEMEVQIRKSKNYDDFFDNFYK
jgi:hypothetical protein